MTAKFEPHSTPKEKQYRIYSVEGDNTLRLSVVQATSFRDAVNALIEQTDDTGVEPDIRSIHRLGSDATYLVGDCFLNALMKSQLKKAMPELQKHNVSTSEIAALLSTTEEDFSSDPVRH